MRSLIESWDGIGVVCRFDAPTGTWIFIALHDDTMGSPSGGTRIRVYKTPEEGLSDAMRLAEGMTYKWAAIDFDVGGGKAVLAVPRPLEGEPRIGLLRSYGRLVESLHGSFRTGVDLGTTPADMLVVAAETRFVHGVTEDGASVDPGPFTARGVYSGMRAALRQVFGSDDPAGRSVLVQGLGDVGEPLVRLLADAGARLLIADIDESRLGRVAAEMGAETVAPDRVYETPCDVFSPCAVGGVLNGETIPRLRCRIVAGSANNQLREDGDAERLHRQGIAYAPDWVINAGGAMAFGLLGRGMTAQAELFAAVEGIGGSVADILRQAAERDESPLAAAVRRVEEILAQRRRG